MTTPYLNLLKARHVWRWSIVNTGRRQSVAEHSYSTWVIGMELFDRFYQLHNTPERASFGQYLLTHDADEAITGDLPSTTKVVMEQLKPGITAALVSEMTGGRKALAYGDTHVLGRLAKCADLIEAWLFLKENSSNHRVLDYQHARLLQLLKLASIDFPTEKWDVVMALFTEIQLEANA